MPPAGSDPEILASDRPLKLALNRPVTGIGRDSISGPLCRLSYPGPSRPVRINLVPPRLHLRHPNDPSWGAPACCKHSHRSDACSMQIEGNRPAEF
jgi:hypothetical protein